MRWLLLACSLGFGSKSGVGSRVCGLAGRSHRRAWAGVRVVSALFVGESAALRRGSREPQFKLRGLARAGKSPGLDGRGGGGKVGGTGEWGRQWVLGTVSHCVVVVRSARGAVTALCLVELPGGRPLGKLGKLTGGGRYDSLVPILGLTKPCGVLSSFVATLKSLDLWYRAPTGQVENSLLLRMVMSSDRRTDREPEVKRQCP